MEHVSLNDLENAGQWASVTKRFGEPLALSDSALNYYELEPGESTAYGFHTHENQEEVFYVQAGELTFRTAGGDVTVGAGEFARFGPGEFQRSHNEGEETAVVLAVGAPRDAGETAIQRECEACGEPTGHHVELASDRDAVVAVCEVCGSATGRYE